MRRLLLSLLAVVALFAYYHQIGQLTMQLVDITAKDMSSVLRHMVRSLLRVFPHSAHRLSASRQSP